MSLLTKIITVFYASALNISGGFKEEQIFTGLTLGYPFEREIVLSYSSGDKEPRNCC